ncbi:MFS transporter [Halodesulfovibrio marinisediminis]|uniref:MFS transporter, putative metabolite transport protein n=1 Tax=Halodesulfovibrio marinisediminis DSM 17456 TaxID=1121457 RepID=A0A1N6ED18_9BACT|nr:MFS transporter [Halodesulfovibrio marinisediminis]SIN80942.1 MFS transporter, putative metabolite transport protein [Halodesulfovibrio marinisediminis DSM 17456]
MMGLETNKTTISFDKAPYSAIHKKLTLGTFMGQVSDGYILGIIGIALSYTTGYLDLNGYWMGLIGAGALFGILFGSLLTGILVDKVGRKQTYLIVPTFSLFFSVIQFFLTDPLHLVIVRFLLGVCVGADYAVGVSLLSEWTPKRILSKIMGWLIIAWTLGYIISYFSGFFIASLGDLGENGWRWILSSSALFAAITLVVRIGSPESPTWTLANKGTQPALELVHKYLGKNFTLPELEEEAKSASFWKLFSPELWRSTVTSCTFYLCQVLPFFAISIFLPIVVKGLNIENPHASGMMYNAFTFIGVLLGVAVIDKVSRRAFLLWTFYGAAALLTLMTICDLPATPTLILLGAFSTCLALSTIIEYLYPAELFPPELRGSGVGLTIAASRIGAGMGTWLLPVISEQYGTTATLGCCVGSLVIGGLVCQLFAPETSPQFVANRSTENKPAHVEA